MQKIYLEEKHLEKEPNMKLLVAKTLNDNLSGQIFFWNSLEFFEHLFLVQRNDTKGWLIKAIIVNGVMLPQRLCAKINNLALFLHQNR